MAQPTKVFVGSLPPGTKPEELRHLFEKYGIVVECDVMNRCGFVHMKNAAMAESAIVALNASEFKGQTIVVEHGRPKERKQIGGGGGRGASGRGGNQNSTRGRRGNVGDGMGHMLVGFPSGQNSNGLSQAATLQLAGMVMELLGDQQNQIDDISGGNNMRGGGGGGSSGGNDHGFRRGSGGGRRSGNFQGSNRGGNQNMNGVGPIRNQGFKLDRPGPYSQGINMQPGSTGGGRYNNQANGYQDRNSMDGRGGVGPGGNFNNTRGNNNNNARGGNFNNNARGGNFAPKSAPSNYASGNNSWNNDQRGVGSMPPQQGGRNFSEDNFAGGFSGNMGNRSGGNFGGQQDRRGFTLPSNQFDQYGGSSNNSGSGFVSNDVGVRSSFNDEAMFHRRTNNQSNVGDGIFNRGSNQGGQDAVGGRPGGFQINRGSQQGFQEQQGSGFKRRGNNMRNSGDNYQQNFPPLGGGNQGAFGNNRFQGGQGGRGGGGGGGMNRNAPRQTMPMRRY